MKGKKILLGVTGSIAAYKAAYLTRLLVKAGAEVRIIMTSASTEFITPLTLSTLSKNIVITSMTTEDDSWNNHVDLGLWADIMLIAPLTAATASKMANGHCDNMLVAVYLSARCPVFFAPAMDLDMWHHPSTQQNIKRLQSFGNQLIPVGVGELASGLKGEGRMAEPEDIVFHLENWFKKENQGLDKNMLITAGPTYEAIDPVRFIGNRSSGKMGVAIADEAAKRGFSVKLVLGPSRVSPSEKGVEVISVQSAKEMYEAANEHFAQADIAIFAAAVADYRPREAAAQKIKKKTEVLNLELVKNPDIAYSLGQKKSKDQITVGFALETNDGFENAQEKLKKKNFDFVVLNSLKDEGAGFNVDTNKITIIGKGNKIRKFELKSKTAVAADIIDEVISSKK